MKYTNHETYIWRIQGKFQIEILLISTLVNYKTARLKIKNPEDRYWFYFK